MRSERVDTSISNLPLTPALIQSFISLNSFAMWHSRPASVGNDSFAQGKMSGVCIGADIYLDVYWNDFMYTRIVEAT